MNKHVLITGGAGFIGSHVADALLVHGYKVRAFDQLSKQVHGGANTRPSYLSREIEVVVGDIRDPGAVRRALSGVDAVYHFAAMVGVGQSMYRIADYTSVNNLGTAVLMEALVERPIERLIVASSMSLYGEGLYRAPDGTLLSGEERSIEQLKAHAWELRDVQGNVLTPVPTPESKAPSLRSLYALSKFDQERMCLVLGRAYNIPAVALRFFNVFGPRQALSNPYTGVLAIFGSRYLNGKPPLINEDGKQRRDFVSVHDVAQACRLALEAPTAVGRVINVASGESHSVNDVARLMAKALNCEDVEPEVTGRYRAGDIRHCFADITLARELLGYSPQVTLERGIVELADWLDGQVAVDLVGQANAELASRGLSI